MTEPSAVVPAVEEAVPVAGEAAVATPDPAAEEVRPSVADGGTGVLLVLGLAWLGTRLWSANANIHDAGDALSRLVVAAQQLPDVIGASTLAGAACAVACLAWIAGRRPATGRPVRSLTGTLAGLVVGLLAGGAVLLAYGHRSPDLVLALSVAVACTLGGALAAVPPVPVMAAGAAATLGAFVVGVALNLYSSRIVDLFGRGSTAQSLLAAENRAALAESLLAGLIAGLIAFWYLRRRVGDRRFLAYLGAGVTPGVLILVAELVTRVGGGQLLNLARKISPADSTASDYLGSARVNHALIVLFSAAIVALIAFGRTLPRKQRQPH